MRLKHQGLLPHNADETFKLDGMNIWHSVGEAGGQEVVEQNLPTGPGV